MTTMHFQNSSEMGAALSAAGIEPYTFPAKPQRYDARAAHSGVPLSLSVGPSGHIVCSHCGGLVVKRGDNGVTYISGMHGDDLGGGRVRITLRETGDVIHECYPDGQSPVEVAVTDALATYYR